MDTSYLSQQVNTVIGQLHGLFDEIGVSDNEREARETEVRAIRLVPLQILRTARRHRHGDVLKQKQAAAARLTGIPTLSSSLRPCPRP